MSSNTLLAGSYSLSYMGKMLDQAKQVLATNCGLLKRLDDASDVKMAKKGGVAAKTVNNLYNMNTNPTLKSIVAVAEAYGVEPWQLLHPNFSEGLPSESDLRQLSKALAELSDADFAAVLRAREQDA